MSQEVTNLADEKPLIRLPDESKIDVMLVDVEKAFPQIEIMTKGMEYPTKERMPSVARMDAIRPDELVWLTTSAVKERIETLLHTDPRFNVSSSSAMMAHNQATGTTVERSNRKGIPPQEMIKKFEEMGFAFAVVDGKTVMLVNAVIAAAKNTNGRRKAVSVGSQSKQGNEYYGTAFVAEDEGKVGFQPADLNSTHVIAVPLDDILKMHSNEEPDIVRLYKRDQAEISLGRKLSDDEAVRIVNEVFSRWQRYPELRDDPVFRARIEEIENQKTNKEKKAHLFDFLMEALAEKDLVPYLFNSGYFPYEPVIGFTRFSPELKKPISFDTLKNIFQNKDEWQKGEIPVELMLDEIASAVRNNRNN